MKDVDVRDFNNVGNLMINLTNVSFTTDVIGKPCLSFWLDQDQADRLAFGINAAIQDYEMKTLKAGETLRETEALPKEVNDGR